MTKKVWVEAEITEKIDDSVTVTFEGLKIILFDKKIIHEIPEPAELPKFVADMIKRGNECNEKLSETFRKIYGPGFWGASSYEKAAKWARENPYEFARAWRDGYVIEKEPKYEVNIPDTSEDISYFLRKSDGKIHIAHISNVFLNDTSSGIDSEFWKENYQLTEDEIKEKFEWTWQFAKKVGNDDE